MAQYSAEVDTDIIQKVFIADNDSLGLIVGQIS